MQTKHSLTIGGSCQRVIALIETGVSDQVSNTIVARITTVIPGSVSADP